MIVIKTIIFLIIAPGSVTILFPYLLLSSKFELFFSNPGILRFLGLFPIIIGATIVIWCFWDFIFTGRGTPAPIDPPKKLVVKGLYRFVRNPMYLGVAFILFGEVLLFESMALLLYVILVLLVFHLFVICYEEPVLKRKFGDSYKEYFNSVPRWIPDRKNFQDILKRSNS